MYDIIVIDKEKKMARRKVGTITIVLAYDEELRDYQMAKEKARSEGLDITKVTKRLWREYIK